MKELSPANAYDALAPTYRAICRRRAAYRNAVDRIVLGNLPRGARSLLDVGAGDGRRGARLARAARIANLVLAEPSPAMAAACRRRRRATVWTTTAQTLPDAGGRFDVVTCLWNVLGHVPTEADRVEALRRMGGLLADAGVLFVDVNHRYNARAYGVVPTAARMLRDAVLPSPRNGDVTVTWRVTDRDVRIAGHVFTRREMTRMLEAARLRIRAIRFVDYGTGEEHRRATCGQLLYLLERGS